PTAPTPNRSSPERGRRPGPDGRAGRRRTRSRRRRTPGPSPTRPGGSDPAGASRRSPQQPASVHTPEPPSCCPAVGPGRRTGVPVGFLAPSVPVPRIVLPSPLCGGTLPTYRHRAGPARLLDEAHLAEITIVRRDAARSVPFGDGGWRGHHARLKEEPQTVA